MISRALNLVGLLGKKLGLRRDYYLIILAAVIGTVTAFGAIGFVELLHVVAHEAVLAYALHPLAVIAVPMLGALATGLLVHFFAREAKGHGVPEVMDALYRKKAVIRPRVAVVKSIASACTIGSGGSAGAEGPIVQIGSAIGSGLAQVLRVPRDQAATLLGCGAAAGIASVFNAPIAGIFFVLEILLRDFSLRTFTPIVVASVFSALTTQAWYGENDAIFAVTSRLAEYQFTFVELPNYMLLGLVSGLVAVGFIRALYWTEDVYARVKIHPILKPVSGALVLGVLGLGFIALVSDRAPEASAPPFYGNGYEVIRDLIEPSSFAEPGLEGVGEPLGVASPDGGGSGPAMEDASLFTAGANQAVAARPVRGAVEPVSTELWFLLGLVGAKIVATCLTLGSGGSGGVFAPSLFLGAATGAALGAGLGRLGLIPAEGSPAAYALVGMGAVVAGTTHAPLTAILILFELTRDEYVLLPIMLAAVLATLSAQFLLRDSVYTLKLRRRGVLVGSTADLTILRRLSARDITPVPHVEVHPEDPLSKLSQIRGAYRVADFIVADHTGSFLGMVTSQDMRTALLEREAIPYMIVEELLRRDLPTIHPDDTLDTVLEKFSKHDVTSLPLLTGDSGQQKVSGLITRARLLRRYQLALAEDG